MKAASKRRPFSGLKDLKALKQRAANDTRKPRKKTARKKVARKATAKKASKKKTSAKAPVSKKVRIRRVVPVVLAPAAPIRMSLSPLAPKARRFRLSGKEAGIAAGGVVGLGLLYLLVSKTPSAKAAPALPPSAPSSPVPPPVPSAPPATPPPAESPVVGGLPGEFTYTTPPAPFWSPPPLTLNSLEGFHRAKQKELTPEVIAMSPSALKYDEGTIHYVKSRNKVFGLAIEGSHNNHPEIGPTNKGVSIFVKD